MRSCRFGSRPLQSSKCHNCASHRIFFGFPVHIRNYVYTIVKVTSVVSDSLQPRGLYSPWNSLSQNNGVGSLSLLQGIFPTQGWNSGLPNCRQILYQLSHQGSPRILEWVTYTFSVDLPDPGIESGTPALQADSLLTELSRKP